MENGQPAPESVAVPPAAPAAGGTPSTHHRYRHWFGSHKKWLIPLILLLVILVLAAMPWTRYKLAGLAIKKDFTVQVTDATAHIPVSGATVSVGSISATTSGSGQAVLHGVKPGNQTLNISKNYYQTKTTPVVVGLFSQKTTPNINLTATGRQVKIKVTNTINGETLANAGIQVANTSSKTDNLGEALLVLPANASSQKAQLSLDGYNDAEVEVQVSDNAIKENDFKLTPVGKVYFVSKRSGTLDLMKSNLDGSQTEVVAPGSGSEQTYETSLLQSADGKYVALVSKRSSKDKQPQLYVLAAADDKLFQADSGNATFQLYGWVGDTLIYSTQRHDLPTWQQGVSKIKAYNAATGGTTLLDQSVGSSTKIDANEIYSEIMVTPSVVVYGKVWQGDGDYASKQNSLQTIGVNGKNHQVIATYPSIDWVDFARHSPNSLYIRHHSDAKDTDKYSLYTVGGGLKPVDIDSDQFYGDQLAYYYSASGNQTVWSEDRDGKSAMLVGDQAGEDAKVVASLADYDAYGWYTDQYLLLSKNHRDLYIMSAKGGKPVKISGYQDTGYSAYGY